MLCCKSVVTICCIVLTGLSLCATGFTLEVFESFFMAMNINVFGMQTTTRNVAITSMNEDASAWRFRVVPEDFSEPQGFNAIYALGSMFNHSCDPNVINHFQYDRNKFWQATQKISEGDELFISYVPPDASLEERKKKLLGYDFECNCPKCKAGI
jgi:hypothetical protein